MSGVSFIPPDKTIQMGQKSKLMKGASMLVQFLKDHLASPDGITVNKYNQDGIYDLPTGLATNLRHAGVVRETVSSKSIESAPMNKMADNKKYSNKDAVADITKEKVDLLNDDDTEVTKKKPGRPKKRK